MTLVTLLEKVYGPYNARVFKHTLSSLCKGLKVDVRVLGTTEQGWIQADVSGEDEEVALRYIDWKIGLAPVSIERLKKFSIVRGRVTSSRKSKTELYVDIGILDQECYAEVPLGCLQAQLVDGRKFALRKIIELFCLYPNFPLSLKIISLDYQSLRVKAELSEAQLRIFSQWLSSYLDRLVVLGAQLSEVRKALKASKHLRDVIKVETLGFLESVVVCKLGTEALGLITEIGSYLPSAVLAPFSPKKIVKLTNRPYLI